MDTTTARQILDVNSAAGESEIRQAFREKVQEEHPDQSDEPDEYARERFKNVKEARDVLLEDGAHKQAASPGRQSRSSTKDSRQRSSSRDPQGTERSGTTGTQGTSSTRDSQQTSSTRDPRETSSTTRGSSSRTTNRRETTSTTSTRSDSREANSTGRSNREQEKTHRSSTDTDWKGRTVGTNNPPVPLNTVTRGYFLERWVLSSTDRTLIWLSIGTVVYSFTAIALHPDRQTVYSPVVIGIWIALCGYIGYLLIQDEIPRLRWEVDTVIRDYTIVVSPFEGSLLPVVGFFVGIILAVPVWVGIGAATGLIDSIVQALFSVQFGLSDLFSQVFSVELIMDFLVILYAPLVALFSVGAGYVHDGPYLAVEYEEAHTE